MGLLAAAVSVGGFPIRRWIGYSMVRGIWGLCSTAILDRGSMNSRLCPRNICKTVRRTERRKDLEPTLWDNVSQLNRSAGMTCLRDFGPLIT